MVDSPPELEVASPKSEDFVDGLLEKHRPQLVRYVGQLLRSSADAQDVVHEVYLRALEKRGELREHANPVGWLMRSAMNLVIDGARKSEMAERHIPTITAQMHPPEDELPMWQRVHPNVLRRAIARLEGDDHTIATMKLDGRTFDEIAKRLGCSITTAFRRFRAVLARLEDLVHEEIARR